MRLRLAHRHKHLLWLRELGSEHLLVPQPELVGDRIATKRTVPRQEQRQV
jgi:hypothetical protein